MNLKEFCDGTKTDIAKEQPRGLYGDEWAKRSGVVYLKFPNGEELPLSTDAIHILNLLRRYKDPTDIVTLLEDNFGGESSNQVKHVELYLDVLAKRGVVKSANKRRHVKGEHVKKVYNVSEDGMKRCSVSSIVPAPVEGERRVITASVGQGMRFSLGEEMDDRADPELMSSIYPKV